MRRVVVAAVLIAVAVAGCSSTAKTPVGNASDIGQPGSVTSSGVGTAVALGSPIWKGALLMSIAQPVTVQFAPDHKGLVMSFSVTMSNTGGSGNIDGPKGFLVRCDANRHANDDAFTDYWPATNVVDRTIAPGQSVSGVALVPWLSQNSMTRCSGMTTIEALWPGAGRLEWTIPADVVVRVNAAVPVGSSPTP
jgi:hypothetical protein